MIRGIHAWFKQASPPRDVVLTIAGALIGWLIAHFYYVRALHDMQADANERSRVNELLLRGIEAVGEVKYSRDASGRVVGIVIDLEGNAASQSAGTGNLTVVPDPGMPK